MPTTEQLTAVSQIPVLVLAMVVVLMAMVILIPVIRGLFSKQNSQDKNLEQLYNMLAKRDEQFAGMDKNYDTLAEARKSQSDTYAVLATALTKSIAELPTQISLAVTAAFLEPFKLYVGEQTKMVTEVVNAQTKFLTEVFKSDSEKTALALEQMRKEFNEKLEAIKVSTTKTAASVDEATGGPQQQGNRRQQPEQPAGLTVADVTAAVQTAVAGMAPAAPAAPAAPVAGATATTITDADVGKDVTVIKKD